MFYPRLACSVFIGLLASKLCAGPNPLVRTNETPEQLIARAASAEKVEDWEKALDTYLRVFLAGRQTPEIRQSISRCNRLSAQIRRQRDPIFQRHILELSTADSLNLYSEVIEKLSALHPDRERATPMKLFLSGIEELERAIGNPTFKKAHLHGVSEVSLAKFRKALNEFWKTKLPTTAREARAAALELTRSAAKELGIKNGSVFVFELLCGSCHGLDEYTVYLSPLQSTSPATAALDELASYGLIASIHKGILTVDRIVSDSWASDNTMIKPGDRIPRINGRLVTDLETLAEALRSLSNMEHEFEIIGEMTSGDSSLVRLPTPLPTVQSASILNMKEGIGYVKLTGFNEQTPLELDAVLARLKEQGIRSLILDLRGNSGGQFVAGIRVAERFIPAGLLASTEGQLPEFAGRIFTSESGMSAFDFPMTVLIDSRTMSIAEVVASSLKDHNRATLIGMPTFGKGVVQHTFKLNAADNPLSQGVHKVRSGSLVLTIAIVHTARGNVLHGHGVMPDLIESDPARQLSLAIERLTPR